MEHYDFDYQTDAVTAVTYEQMYTSVFFAPLSLTKLSETFRTIAYQ